MKLMNKAAAAGIFFLVTGILFIFSQKVDPQASMDATYYHILAERVAAGQGFTEPFVWHHLNDYSDLTHPIDYWMPLGIIFYAFAEKLSAGDSQVWLNIIIWAFLATAVFIRILRDTGQPWAALTAAMVFALCGRMMFYLLTTDNIAFYALIGFAFISCHANSKDVFSSPFWGAVATLMRIEGLIFSVFGFFIKTLQQRQIKTSIVYVVVFLVVLLPWILRNVSSLETPWPSNSKALFLRSYDDFFREDFPGTLRYYLDMGGKKIIEQKISGLTDSFLNLIAVPGLFILFPFWLAGIASLWKCEGRVFAFLLFFMWLLCGILFTHQSARGTALHISAFFLPHFAVFLGHGLSFLVTRPYFKPWLARLTGVILVVWAAFFSHYSVETLVQKYNFEKEPYQKLFSRVKLPSSECLVSINPIMVYGITGNRGVISGVSDAAGIVKMADRFKCGYVLLDMRAKPELLNNFKNWQIVASESPLLLYQRIDRK